MKATSIKAWVYANIAMLVAVVIFAVIIAVATTVLGGSFFKNGVAFSLVGVCVSIWHYAKTKEAPVAIKVLATMVTIMVAIVIYGMYFVI